MVQPRRATLGFTLLEMLVALALIAVLASVLYASLRIGFDARRRADAALGDLRVARVVADLVQRDLVQALPSTGVLIGAFVGEDATMDGFGADADAVSFFASLEDGGRAPPAVCRVDILAESSAATGTPRLIRRVSRDLLAPSVEEPVDEVLCSDVAGFNLRYYDGSFWSDSWDSTTRGDALPIAIEMRVDVKRSREAPGVDHAEPYSLTRIFLLPCAAMGPTQDGTTRGAGG